MPARPRSRLPAVVIDAGPEAVERFLEYFAAAIAKARAVGPGSWRGAWLGA